MPKSSIVACIVACALISTGCLTDRKCQSRDWCKENGGCTAHEGHCVAATEDDCRSSEVCAEEGKCYPMSLSLIAFDGRCHVQEAEDCLNSTICAEEGLCSLGRNLADTENACVAGSDRDCEQSKRCKDEGYCEEVNGDCRRAGWEKGIHKLGTNCQVLQSGATCCWYSEKGGFYTPAGSPCG